jgi:hypothetical protein
MNLEDATMDRKDPTPRTSRSAELDLAAYAAAAERLTRAVRAAARAAASREGRTETLSA